MRDQEQEQKRESILRDRLWEVISRNAPDARLNGVTAHRLANTLNISFPGMSSETLLMALDLEGVCASSGSACMVGSVVASHVLLAMGLPPALASSTVRFSLGKETTANEIECAGEAIVRILKRLDQVRAGRQSNAHVAA
jgi:cysteine desulfurase